MKRAPAAFWITLSLLLLLTGGCSMRSMAADTIGDMLASGDGVFTDDDDIELIGEALPFSIKLVESMILESPEHRGLLLAAARGYVLYAYAYVQFPAEQAAGHDLAEARRLRARAGKLYLRAFGYAIRALEVEYPGLGAALARAPEDAVGRIDDEAAGEVPYLYWSAAALGLAISVSKRDTAMLARLPEVEALLQRGLALDADFDNGALHEFAMVWAEAIPGTSARGDLDAHYRQALGLSAGKRASVYVTYAVAKAVPSQDRALFDRLLADALAVDPDALPEKRLQNTIAQRRARWLLARSDKLFLE